MKKTLVVYSPGSKSDIKIWLKKHGYGGKLSNAIFLDGSTGKYKIKANEQILIIEKFNLNKSFYCDKLVLLGQFGELDLSKINKYIKFI